MWTLRSSAVSLMAEDGEFMGEGQTSNGARCKSRIEQRVQAGNLRAATCTSITPSMTIHASRIQRSSLTRRRESAASFWERARAFFTDAGVTITGVMTDNGPCYRSHAFAEALGPTVKHRFTRPYRPQTNGKVERFNRTLAQEWAYAVAYESEEARAESYGTWLHH